MKLQWLLKHIYPNLDIKKELTLDSDYILFSQNIAPLTPSKNDSEYMLF